MANPQMCKLSVATVSMSIVVTTFGLSNIIDNLVELEPSTIPSDAFETATELLPPVVAQGLT